MGEEGLGRMLLGLDKSCHVCVCVCALCYIMHPLLPLYFSGGGGGGGSIDLKSPTRIIMRCEAFELNMMY